MKTSRSSVREAVSKLEALNIVSVEHGKGTFVGSLSLDPMVETLALRSMVSVGQNFEDLRNVVQLRRFLDIGCADEVCIALHGIPQPELSAIAAQMTQDALAGKTFLREDINFHIGNSAQSTITQWPSRWCAVCGKCIWRFCHSLICRYPLR